jgi:hypothetical protein
MVFTDKKKNKKKRHCSSNSENSNEQLEFISARSQYLAKPRRIYLCIPIFLATEMVRFQQRRSQPPHQIVSNVLCLSQRRNRSSISGKPEAPRARRNFAEKNAAVDDSMLSEETLAWIEDLQIVGGKIGRIQNLWGGPKYNLQETFWEEKSCVCRV